MNGENSNGTSRTWLAYAILIFSGVAITTLSVVVVLVDSKNALTILNIVLPVVASWVGTILAFYFGRENFESANKQVRDLVAKLTPEERASSSISTIMRPLATMYYFAIPQGKGDADIQLKDLLAKFTGDVSRLPVLETDKKPKYMLHGSSIDKYIRLGKQDTDTLETFINNQKQAGIEFGVNRGFVVVAETMSISMAKREMDSIPVCQDIFVTKNGTANEPLVGWVSNVRLAKFLKT